MNKNEKQALIDWVNKNYDSDATGKDHLEISMMYLMMV